MHMRPRLLLVVVAFSLLVPPVAALDHEPSGGIAELEQPFTLELAGARAADVFASFAAILEAELELDPAVEGEVTIELREVSLATSLEAVCEMLECSFAFDPGPPRRLIVGKGWVTTARRKAPSFGDLDTPIDMELRDAPVRRILESFASIGGWGLDLAEPKVTIDVRSTPVREALDEVCRQAGCAWSLDESVGRGILRVEWLD